MMASPAKFRFDLDLGRGPSHSHSHGHGHDTAPQDSGNLMAALVAEARAEAFQEGLAEGERLAATRAEQRLATAAQQLADHAAALNAALDDSRRQLLEDAAALAATVGRKLAASLLAAEPTTEIDQLLGECLASLDTVPHLVVRCHPDLADAVRDLATARIAHSGFTGRLVVLGEPDRQLGDARIEWADGGVERDRSAIEAEIGARIARYIAARRRPAAPPAEDPANEPQPHEPTPSQPHEPAP